MKLTRVRALRGPNLWSRSTAIEAIVVCERDELDIRSVPGLLDRLRLALPEPGAIPASGAGSVSLAHVLEAVTLHLQRQAGCPVLFSRTVSTVEPGAFQVVVEYREEAVGRLALESALRICEAALAASPIDCRDIVARLRDLDEDQRLGPSTGAIVDAAVLRGIPYRRLTEGSLVQFGWGSRQRRIQAAELDQTSAIAESIAQDKDLTKSLLASAGIPVPRGRPVEDAEDAWAAAQEVGGPVVVKPRHGNQGKGVTVNIAARDDVLKAWAVAREFGSDVIVESCLSGFDFRLLVVGNRLVAAARRDPPLVFGDGQHTIRELVDRVNKDPRRGDGHATSLTRIRLDEIALARLAAQGLTPDSVPGPGVRIVLRNNANLSTGGSATDVTDEVHPEVAARAVAAARIVGLDICGADLVCNTVAEPLESQGGGFVEVNAAPGLRMHLSPSFGSGRPVGQAIVDNLFPDGGNGRIPVVAVSGTNGKTTTVRLVAHLAAGAGHRVGMTNSDGVYIGAQRIDTGDCSGPRSARSVLMHPDVDFAVFETARGGILREGLAFDRCDVAVVTNIGEGDHLGLNYITTVEDLAVVKRVIVENVSPTGFAVLNAADPIVASMASRCPGSVIFFAADSANPTLSSHRAQGGRVVFTDNGQLVASQGDETHRIALSAIPLTRHGTIAFQVDNAMAALAAAWAVGLDWATIRAGLGSFNSDSRTAPGRFNLFEYRGATIVADYGHNPDAIAALVRAVDAMPARHRHVVISGAGDRRDEDLRRQTSILGNAFDSVILYEDACQRGRVDGEVVGLLREGLSGATRTQRIDEIRGEFLAIDTALSRLEPGDLCLILVDQVEEALAHIESRVAAGMPKAA
jgi:cyanophycin synthetase